MIKLPNVNLPKIWKDSTCFIVGGGPSLRNMDLAPIHDKHVIGVNDSYQLGDWVDVVFFGDNPWYRHHRKDLQKFGGLKCCCLQIFGPNDDILQQAVTKDRIHVYRRGRRFGISPRPDRVAWNLNNGANAINLAYHLGATKVVLLGFDMHRGKRKPGDIDSYKYQDNWHSNHLRMKGRHPDQLEAKPMTTKASQAEDPGPYKAYLRCFPYIRDQAKGLGLTILNATPGSAIPEDIFPHIELKDTL